MMRIFAMVKIVWNIAVFGAAAMFWTGALLRDGISIARDAWASRHAIRTGTVVCVKGHSTSLFGKFECSSCGFRYVGHALRCPNKECLAPATAFLNCSEPSCGLAIRAPSRWGSP